MLRVNYDKENGNPSKPVNEKQTPKMLVTADTVKCKYKNRHWPFRVILFITFNYFSLLLLIFLMEHALQSKPYY